MRNSLPDKLITVLLVILVFFTNGDGHESKPPDSEKDEDSVELTKDLKTEEVAKESGKITSWLLYKKLFEQNRAVQLEAVKTMQNYGDYAQRYKLVDIVLKQLFKVLGEGKVNLTEWGYAPGDPFPTNQTIREGVSKVLENTAMFGDMVLRLPDIVHEMYDKTRQWHELIAWGVWFCEQSNIFVEASATAELLHLMSQEINLIERDEDYINPFTSVNVKLREEELNRRVDAKQKIKMDKKKKKEKKRGPRMSGGSRIEL